MLTLIEGGFTSVCRDELIKKILTGIESGKKVFLFVPEQQTLTTEKEMADILPASSVVNFEVTNFTRFTNTAFRALGGISGEYITPAVRSLVMWSTLTELSPLLSMTKGSTNINTGIVSKAMQATKELEALGIKPEVLAAAERAAGISDQRLRSKLSDISMIYSLYKRKLSEKYIDVAEDIAGLKEQLSLDPSYLYGTEIYIDGFTSFTEPQYLLLSELIRSANVTVLLNIPKAERDGYEYRELIDTERRLVHTADGVSADKKLLKPDSQSSKFNSIISDISRLLWRISGSIDNDSLHLLSKNDDILKIYEANTPFDECDFVAADIKRRVISGAKYQDFAIICGSLDKYSGILDTSLEKAGIPHYMSKKESIASREAVKLINTAYSTVIRGFKAEDVITYVKCGGSGVTKRECDAFELYVQRWSIDGRRFTDGLTWNMNPRGYTELTDNDREGLIEVNRIKDKIISPLLNFRDEIRSAGTVREHAYALVDFLTEIKLESELREKSNSLLLAGEKNSADISARLWQIICDSLDTLVDTVGDTPSDAESFINQLNVVFGDTKVGTIPSYIDEVSIGQADTVRLNNKKHIYLIGVNKGEFPAAVSDRSYFTERDKAELLKLGLNVSSDLEMKNARECLSFSRAFSFAHESVRILYALKTSSLGAALPSDIIVRIGEITGGKIKPISLSSVSALEKMYSPVLALENYFKASNEEKAAIKAALLGTEYEDILKISEGSIDNGESGVDKKTMGILVGDSIYLSQTAIDDFLSCPFKYFSKSFLKLDDGKPAKINSVVVGNFIHSVLESFFGTMIERGTGIASLTEEEREELTVRSCESYIRASFSGSDSSAKTDAIIKRICRAAKPIVDGLCDEFANCKFTPVRCEMKIGDRSMSSPDLVTYKPDGSDTTVVLGGKIDRVDAFKSGDDVYVRVVDYKTGIKRFALDDIKEGRNLQMVLYLKSIVDNKNPKFKESMGASGNGRLIPAGIVYIKTSVDDVTVEESSDSAALEKVKTLYERLGASLDDEVSLNAMNPDYTPSAKPSKNSPPSPIKFTIDEWNDINKQMEKVILNVADSISRGSMPAAVSTSASAYHPCTYCNFRYLCRKPEE